MLEKALVLAMSDKLSATEENSSHVQNAASHLSGEALMRLYHMWAHPKASLFPDVPGCERGA